MFNGKDKSRSDLAPWEQFCKDEARRTAHEFLEKVRRLQTTDPSSMEIPENVFATKFSAHFLDEVVDLTGGPADLTMSAEVGMGGGSRREKKSNSGKSWWNIFKRKQSKEDRNVLSGKRAVGSAGYQGSARGVSAHAILEANVKMLDLNSPTQSMSWQQCRLVLTSEQGNHQLEVYCPPKSTFPKMSLFCFLLEDVRSTTDLELPDSLCTFVVKSDNHGEYVFDAGGEKEKEEWIRTIRSYSSNLCHQHPIVNGHVTTPATPELVKNGRPRSQSSSVMEQVQRPQRQYEHSVLLSYGNDSHYSERGAQPGTASRDNFRPTLKSFSASPSPCRSGSLRRNTNSSSACSTPCGTPERETLGYNPANYIRCRPQRPSPKPRRTLSMYEHSSQVQTEPRPGASPPLPKRTQHFMSSLNEITSPPPALLADHSRERSKGSSNPAIVTSSPTDRHLSSTRGNLETSSQTSSSSALHPVTLAANQQRSKNGRRPSASSLTGLGGTSPMSGAQLLGHAQLSPSHVPSSPKGHKLSNPMSASPSGSTNWAQDIEDEVKKAKQRFPSCDGFIDFDYEAGAGPSILSNGNSSHGILSTGRRRQDGGTPSPPQAHRNPMKSPSSSPSVPRRYSPSLNTYIEEASPQDDVRGSEVIEVFPSRESEVLGAMPPTPPQLRSKPRNLRFWSDTQVERVQMDRHTPRTPSPATSSSSTSESHRAEGGSSNPIYIELRGPHSHPPSLPTHTSHPYQTWAVTHQDAQNLRDLAQFPWFHGMISRTNATQLVLVDGDASSGKYLVRQSESREGEFVLTFNYKGRAKHLRIVVDSAGCSVQHLFFPNVSNMLDYFKQNTIPLETCWNEEDCRITEFIDRSISDGFRTITVINPDQLLNSPRVPRRSHSLHLALTQVVMASVQNSAAASGGRQGSEGPFRRQSSSLPQGTRHSTGWRSLFRPGTLQRRHSENSNNLHTIDNNYTTRY